MCMCPNACFSGLDRTGLHPDIACKKKESLNSLVHASAKKKKKKKNSLPLSLSLSHLS